MELRSEMTIFITSSLGKTITFKAKPWCTVESLRTEIQRKENIPVTDQIVLFIFENDKDVEVVKVLSHGKTLKDYGIKHQTTVFWRSHILNCKEGRASSQDVLVEPIPSLGVTEVKNQKEGFMMTIFCNIKYGNQITLQVRGNSTIDTVKSLVKTQENIAAEEQLLTLLTDTGDLLRWVVLEDGKTLNDYNIAHGETIFLKRISLNCRRSSSEGQETVPARVNSYGRPLNDVGISTPQDTKPQKSMKIYCNETEIIYNEIIVSYDPSFTIDKVKSEIQNATGIPKDMQRIMLRKGGIHCSAVDLEDYYTLKHLITGTKNKLVLKLKRTFGDDEPINTNEVGKTQKVQHPTGRNIKIFCCVDIYNETQVKIVYTNSYETIEDVKLNLQKCSNIPTNKQCLWVFKMVGGTLCKTVLRDSLTLNDYNIKDGDSIQLKPIALKQKMLKPNQIQMHPLLVQIYCQAKIGDIEKVIRLSVKNSDSVKSIKNVIKDKENIPVYEQRLSSWRIDGENFSWMALEDDFTLDDYGITDGDTMFLKWISATFSTLAADQVSSSGSMAIEPTLEADQEHLQPNTMRIFCQAKTTRFIKQIMIDANPSDTIGRVKAKIEKSDNIRRADQIIRIPVMDSGRLSWKVLEDSQTLKDNGVENGTTIFMDQAAPGKYFSTWSTYKIVRAQETNKVPIEHESSLQTLRVYCKTVFDEEPVKILASAYDTVKDVKREFERKSGLQVHHCCNHSLVFDCDVLDDSTSFRDLGVKGEVTLHSVVKHLGSGRCLKNGLPPRKRSYSSDYEDDIPKSKFSKRPRV